MQKFVIKLTEYNRNGESTKPVLIGVGSIITIKTITDEVRKVSYSDIESRHAMVTHTYVVESVDEIYALINE